ncbi:MAG: extracellular solute-binding protein, partial [Candidatus Puniceispirillum sp.]
MLSAGKEETLVLRVTAMGWWYSLRAAAVFLLLIGGGMSAAFAASINIYSHRQQALIQPFLDAFTAETGVETKVVYAAKGLAQRLQAEGEASPADVILTVDIARLAEYASLDLLAPVSSDILTKNIPARLRAADNRWFSFSERARIIVTSMD